MIDLAVPELARAMMEERIRDADKAHGFSSYTKPSGLLSLLKSLRLPFIRS